MCWTIKREVMFKIEIKRKWKIAMGLVKIEYLTLFDLCL